MDKKIVTDIEKEFGEVAKKINAKIKEAAEALAEANKLAENVKFGVLNYTMYEQEEATEEELEMMYAKMDLIIFDPLMSELDQMGWRTSSLAC